MLEFLTDASSRFIKDDTVLLFNGIAANSVGNGVAFNFLIERWDEMKKV